MSVQNSENARIKIGRNDGLDLHPYTRQKTYSLRCTPGTWSVIDDENESETTAIQQLKGNEVAKSIDVIMYVSNLSKATLLSVKTITQLVSANQFTYLTTQLTSNSFGEANAATRQETNS